MRRSPCPARGAADGNGAGNGEGCENCERIAEDMTAFHAIPYDQADAEDHGDHGDDGGKGGALLEEDPGEERGEHRIEGDDEDDIGGRRVIDRKHKGDGRQAVEQGDGKSGPARQDAAQGAGDAADDDKGKKRHDNGRDAARRQHGPGIAARKPDQRNIHGHRKTADRAQQQAFPVIGEMRGHSAG